jgi:hypothetical protein
MTDTGTAAATAGTRPAAFWWIAGIFAGGAIIGGTLLRLGPLVHKDTLSPSHGEVPAAQAGASPHVQPKEPAHE